jgi:nicotinate-nucleotide adenylyltransferase
MMTPVMTPAMTPTSHMLLARLRARRHGHIGLLGGSFNPAHHGHAHIADVAISELQLDQVIWLASPQNPHKSTHDMAPFADRFASAEAISQHCKHHKRMQVSALEHITQMRYTADTIRFLARTCPRMTFYWLMGADNMATFHQWHRTDDIIRNAHLIVVNRPGYQASALASRIAHRMTRCPARRLRHKPFRHKHHHYWSFIQTRLNPLSATAIRESRQK